MKANGIVESFDPPRLNSCLGIGEQELAASCGLRALCRPYSLDLGSCRPLSGSRIFGYLRQGILNGSLRFDGLKNKQDV